MISAYFDDSATDEGKKVTAVGGYLATMYQWEKFVPKWNALLEKYDIKEMHRSDLETWNGEFTKDRGWNPTRRTELVKKAQAIIKKYTYVAIGSAVINKDFEEIIPELVRDFHGGAYGWCAHECIHQAAKWCESKKHKTPIDWVFERGTLGSSQIQFFFEKCYEIPELQKLFLLKADGWTFKSKALIPLQAADVVAYEVYKQVQNQIVDGGKLDVRLSAADLFREKDHPYLKYWNRERLLQWRDEPDLQPYINMITRYQAHKKASSESPIKRGR